MIARKRRALRAREARAREVQRIAFDRDWKPYRAWSGPRLLKLAGLFRHYERGGRGYRTARSRFLYGCRTGGRW